MIAECKIAVVGRIVETDCVTTGCEDLATNCGLTVPEPVKPVTVAPRTGELNTVGAPLICPPFVEFVVNHA